MATAAGAGGDVHRVLYDAVALCSASCAQRTTTNPTMKGAATPVTVGLDEAPQPHLTRLPIVSASASPTLSDGCTISWPPLTACSHLTRTYAPTLGTGVFGAGIQARWNEGEDFALGWEIQKSEAKTSDIGNLAFLACI